VSAVEQKKGAPPGGGTVRRAPDGEMRISFPRRGPWPWWGQWLGLFFGGSFVVLAWVSVLLMFAEGYSHTLVPLTFFSFLTGAVLLRYMKLVSVSTSRATISIAAGRLRIELATAFRRRRYEWETRQIMGVVSGRFLEIETYDSIYHVTTVRSAEENDWLAHMLRTEFGLKAEAPDSWGNAVQYRHPRWGEICDGYLEAQPSCMILRNGFERRQEWFFCAEKNEGPDVLSRLQQRGAFRLSSCDVTCRVGGDGRTCLRIHPSGKSFDLAIWCADSEALPQALERFWGALG